LAFQVEIYLRQTAIQTTVARIASDANNLTRSIQRAFITVSELRREPVTDQSGKTVSWRFTPAIANSGHTPTEKLAIVSITPRTESEALAAETFIAMDNGAGLPRPHQDESFVEWELGSPPNPDSVFQWTSVGAAATMKKLLFIENALIGPNATVYPFLAGGDISAQDAIDAQSDKIGRFFYGSIHYDDILGGEGHVTKYCFRIDNFVMRYGVQEPVSSYCRHWNCSDKSCEEDKAAYDKEYAAAPKNSKEDTGRRFPNIPPPTPPASVPK